MRDVRNYFEQKFCPKDSTTQKILLTSTPSFQKDITNQEVVESIKKLKNRKCQDSDGFTAKLLKYAHKIASITKVEDFNRAIILGQEIRVNSALLLHIAKLNKTPKL